MRTHQQIDERSLRLAQEVARLIDLDPGLLDRARDWAQRHDAPAIVEWREILKQPWPAVREVLLDLTDEGQRLRQSSPFAGIITPQDRRRIYRESSST